eukprot:15438122-Alexandrium_andersonii.AAC.1
MSAGLSNSVDVETVLSCLQAEGSGLPGTAAFAPLLDFVLSQGRVEDAGPIAELRAFHETVVDPHDRRGSLERQ